jgi:hypothetical protein
MGQSTAATVVLGDVHTQQDGTCPFAMLRTQSHPEPGWLGCVRMDHIYWCYLK